MSPIRPPAWMVKVAGGSRRHRKDVSPTVNKTSGSTGARTVEYGRSSQDWMSPTAEIVRVRGDRSSWWYFAVLASCAMAVLATPLLLCAVAAGEAEMNDLPIVGLIAVALALAYGLAWGVWWLAVTSRNEYVVTSTSLEVRRGRRTLAAVPLADIVEFDIEDQMNAWSIIATTTPPPAWPTGIVTLREGRFRRVLPQIVLWGSYSAAEAESAVRRAISIARGEA